MIIGSPMAVVILQRNNMISAYFHCGLYVEVRSVAITIWHPLNSWFLMPKHLFLLKQLIKLFMNFNKSREINTSLSLLLLCFLLILFCLEVNWLDWVLHQWWSFQSKDCIVAFQLIPEKWFRVAFHSSVKWDEKVGMVVHHLSKRLMGVKYV